MNISFSLTTHQIREKTKFVTRRNGWKKAKKGQVLNACVKCMGLKKGEKIEEICKIRLIHVRREKLNQMTYFPIYGRLECVAEGFPHLTPEKFVEMYCKHMNVNPEDEVTRLQFEYVED